jgi:hypothetical protein
MVRRENLTMKKIERERNFNEAIIFHLTKKGHFHTRRRSQMQGGILQI